MIRSKETLNIRFYIIINTNVMLYLHGQPTLK
jgi:hypothetical protein